MQLAAQCQQGCSVSSWTPPACRRVCTSAAERRLQARLACRAGSGRPDVQDDAPAGAAGPPAASAATAGEPGMQEPQAQPSRPQQQQQQQQPPPPQQQPPQPARRPAGRRRQLDVARAVQLLKLTTVRSDRKNSAKLPPWFMRTQDDQAPWVEKQAAASRDHPHGPSSSSNGSGSSNGSSRRDGNGSSSRGRPLAAIDTMDDAGAAAVVGTPNSTTTAGGSSSSSSSSSGNGSASSSSDERWRSGSNASSSSSGDTQEGRAGSPSRRAYSASDPIRRSARQQNEWSLLPWQEGGDPVKEEERQFRRAVFSFDRWAAHRSTWRYFRHVRGIISSRTLLGLLPVVSFFTAMATTAGLYNTIGLSAGLPPITLSSTSLDITAFAVSLLLVFRTDSSYARFQEALTTWNQVRSLSKDLARQSCYWVNDLTQKEMLIRWTEAFSRALLVHCRCDGSLEDELEDVLLPYEVAAVAAVGPGGAPSFVLQVISELVEQCAVLDIKENNMFLTLRSMGDTIATCDKLLRYPLPLAWSRHTSRFMFIWLSALPWSMWPEAHWAVVPITAAVSYLLLGIDEIGVQIEEPLGILPLEDVCVDIQAEIEAMMERQDIVTDLLVAGGVDCEPRSTCGACGQPVAAAASAAATAAAAVAAAAGGGDGAGGSAAKTCAGAAQAPINGAV